MTENDRITSDTTDSNSTPVRSLFIRDRFPGLRKTDLPFLRAGSGNLHFLWLAVVVVIFVYFYLESGLGFIWLVVFILLGPAIVMYPYWCGLVRLEFHDDHVSVVRTATRLRLRYDDIEWVRIRSFRRPDDMSLVIKIKNRPLKYENMFNGSRTDAGDRDDALEFLKKGFGEKGVEVWQ